jgi:hypothetical protein
MGMTRNMYKTLVDGIKKMSECFMLCTLILRFIDVSIDNNNAIDKE